MAIHSEEVNLNDNLKKKKREIMKDKSSTFSDNMSLPVHRWFRYSAGFSGDWVASVIDDSIKGGADREELVVFDPFVGSGTVLLAADQQGVKGAGIEAHPLVLRIAKAKLKWKSDINQFEQDAAMVLYLAEHLEGESTGYPELIYKCYSTEVLAQLDSIKKAIEHLAPTLEGRDELLWLALVSILRSCSGVGTAQWQYVLPNKTKSRCLEPFEAFRKQISMMASDMATMQGTVKKQQAIIYQDDARYCNAISDNSVDLVITSPPYANNYDYADATRLEMSFLGLIQGWSDLQDKVRNYLVRSCTQHVSKQTKETFTIIQDKLLEPIYPELELVCSELAKARENHGGKKNYHTMIACYFLDLAKVWVALRRICKDGATVCFVIGDSAPYGVYVPVEKWMGELALAAGFREYYFEKTRDRNVKWENRKHKVPLHEGRLWVRG